MDQKSVFLTILGMALVTYLPRVLPTWLLSARTLPPRVEAWLRQVPVAVLAAMLIPDLIVQQGRIDLRPDNIFLLAALPTLLVAWKTKNFFGSVLTGMAVVAGARFFFGV